MSEPVPLPLPAAAPAPELEPELHQRRVEAALAERDAALAELARCREDLAALRLSVARSGEPMPRPYPSAAGPGAPPLRYVLADRLNGAAKVALAPLHSAARALLARVSQRDRGAG